MDSMRVNLKFFEGTIYEEKKETNETLFFKEGKRKVWLISFERRGGEYKIVFRSRGNRIHVTKYPRGRGERKSLAVAGL